MGADVTPLFCESDGTFPNHHPDPTVDENLEDLIRTVRGSPHDLGVAFDGDADRIGAVDETGAIVRGDVLLLLYGLDLLEKRGKGQKLIFDVKCSQVLPEVFAAAGGEPIMWKTGHSLIKQKMKETGALLAGELSGHIMVADDYFGFDDALYDACRLVALVSRTGRNSRGAGRGLSGLCVHSRTAHRCQRGAEVGPGGEGSRTLQAEPRRDRRGRRSRAIRDGWALLRASNTQPAIVARFEAESAERLDEIRQEVAAWLGQHGVSLP